MLYLAFIYHLLVLLLVLLQPGQTLQQRGMGMIPGRVQGVVHWESQIIHIQFDQRTSQILSEAQLLCKLIGLVLEQPGHDGHAVSEQGVVRSQDVREHDHESDKHRLHVNGESKGLIQHRVTEEHAKDVEDEQQVGLNDDDVLRHMTQ